MARVIQIGNRRWLAGMTWASYEDVPHKTELRDDAQRLNATWTALRIGEDCVQGGFCAAMEGVKTNRLYSLAAMLADSKKQPWLGIFKIDEEQDLWWYIAVRDGHAILPNGDVVGGREEIIAARESHSGYRDWTFIEGPDIGFLESLIAQIDERPTPVKSLTGNQHLPTLVAAVMVGASAVAGGGYWWWQQQQQAEAAARQAAMERMRAQLGQTSHAAKQAAPTAAVTMPLPNEVLRACGHAVDLPLSQNGWTFENVLCTTAQATVVWARGSGATVDFRPPGDLSADGEKVTQAIPLGLEQRSGDDLIRLSDAKEQLLAWSQAAGFKVNLQTISAPTPALPGAEPTEAPAVQPTLGVALDINVSPFSLDMSGIPGLRLNNIQSEALGWKVTGELYGR